MEYFPVKNFRPIEAKEDATDQDRSVLRLCHGMIPVPQGALCAPPNWQLMYGMDDLTTDAAALLTGANANKAHILRLARGNWVFLIVWSLQDAKALAIVPVASDPSVVDFAGTGSVALTAPSGSVWRDKDPDAEWFASHIENRVILGNGIDVNLVWTGGALALFGPSAPPADVYNLAKERIPPCTCFRKHVNGSIFAGGNAANPLRVWITAAPNASFAFPDGVQSLATSYVDVRAHAGATRITALSVYQQYVTVHTDRAPVNLYGVNNTADGWKCEQSPSAAAASAINPRCVGDAEGDASFYLGSDLEIYLDQAVRAGPFEKRNARDQEIVTAQASGLWNREMLRPPAAYGYSIIYDRTSRLFWVFARSTYNNRGMVWVYNERTRSLAGPVHYPDAVVTTSVLGSYGIAVTDVGSIVFANLAAVGERIPDQIEAEGTALGSSYAPAGAEPTPIAGVPVVGMTADRLTWIEKLDGSVIGFTNPFNAMGVIDPSGLTIAEWFNNAHIARIETPWYDFGAPSTYKEYLDLVATLERASRGYLGVYAEVEDRKGMRRNVRWYGSIHPETSVRRSLVLSGRRIRFRLCFVLFNDARALLRDLRIGYAGAGQD